MSILSRCIALLDHPRAPLGVTLAALLLASPALLNPLVIDDAIFGARAGAWPGWSGLDDPGTPLFTFADGTPEMHAAQRASGVASWWTPPDFKLAFWRPISAADLRLDFHLWPDAPPLMYAHSLAWFAALLAALWSLYRRLLPRRAALFALAVYALDDARGFVHSLLSHRNSIIATTFAVLAVVAYDRWRRDGWRLGAWAAPALLLLGLLSGEIAVAATGMLFAHALLVEEGPLRARLAALAPLAVATLGWLAAHRAGGWGAVSSGLYVHPMSDPARFAWRLVEQAPILLGAQFGVAPSDVLMMFPPAGKAVWWLVGVATLGLVAVASRDIKNDRVARFWALSAFTAVLPICASFANDRLLGFVGVGAAGLLGLLFDRALVAPPGGWPGRLVAALAVVHLVIAPLALPFRSMTMAAFASATGPIEDWIATQPDVGDRTLVVAGAPADGLPLYALAHLAAADRPRPSAVRVLWTGLPDARVERLGPRTLRVQPRDGFYASEMEQMTRSPDLPFAEGEVVDLGDVIVTVTGIDPRGRALAAELQFAAPLEDPRWLWVRLGLAGPEPWHPPAVGEARTEPALWVPLDWLWPRARSVQAGGNLKTDSSRRTK